MSATKIPSTATTTLSTLIQVIIGVGVSVIVILLILVILIVTLVCGYHPYMKRRNENLQNPIELKNLHQIEEMKPDNAADVYGKPIYIMFIQHGLTSDHKDKPASWAGVMQAMIKPKIFLL